MSDTRRWPASALLSALVVAGCATDPVTSPATAPTSTGSISAPSTAGAPPTPPVPRSPSQEVTVPLPDPSPPARMPAADDRALQDAVNDLRARLDLARDAITVVVDESVTWRDGSLGCPEEGRVYTEALVEGRRVVLVAEGEEHHYHGRRTGPLTPCEDPDPDGWVD